MAADYVWTFTTIPQLTLSSFPVLGGTTTGAGLFAQGSTVTVVATANTGYTFFNWTDGTTVASTNASYQFTMAGNKTLVANFTSRFVVSVLSNPLLGGITTGGGTFNSGASVTVTAAPNAGYTFTNWTEGLNIVSTNANYLFTIAGNRTLVANYNYNSNTYTVAVSSNPLAGGITTGGGTYNSGASITVKAVTNSGYTFKYPSMEEAMPEIYKELDAIQTKLENMDRGQRMRGVALRGDLCRNIDFRRSAICAKILSRQCAGRGGTSACGDSDQHHGRSTCAGAYH